MSATAPSLLPITIRLNALEASIRGKTAYSEITRPFTEENEGGLKKNGESSKTALRRLRDIEFALNGIEKDNDGIKRLIENYDTYSTLLSINDTENSTSDSNGNATQSGSAKSANNAKINDLDIITDQLKLTMVLESQHDIRDLERDLREIQVLKDRGVEGAGELEKLISLRPNLMKGVERSQERSHSVKEVRAQVGDLLMRYNDYTSTLSEMFLEIHHRLQRMEDQVSREERKRKKEASERF